MKNYIKANNESDFESLVEYYPEFFFDSISKKETVKELKKFYSKRSKNKILLDSEFKVDTIIYKNAKCYARIRNGQDITMDLTEFEDENGMDYTISMAYVLFVNEYGEENVKYEKGELIFKIKSDKPLYAIKKEKESWKFIELNETTEKIIPIEIRALEK